MWNDTDIPLAYLITFRTYGTWLHGDERGSIDRFHNQYSGPRIPTNVNWSKHNTTRLRNEPVKLDAQRRTATEQAIREVCEYRKWILRAINVRTNHVHSVVSIGSSKPEKALNDFKSYSTRKMHETKCWNVDSSPWGDRGSKRRLWNEQSVGLACEYVVNGQGIDLPDFDVWLSLKNPPANAGGSDLL